MEAGLGLTRISVRAEALPGPPFSLHTFFWTNKRKYVGSGATPRDLEGYTNNDQPCLPVYLPTGRKAGLSPGGRQSHQNNTRLFLLIALSHYRIIASYLPVGRHRFIAPSTLRASSIELPSAPLDTAFASLSPLGERKAFTLRLFDPFDLFDSSTSSTFQLFNPLIFHTLLPPVSR